MERLLESALLTVGAGAVVSARVKVKRPYVFFEDLNNMQSFMEANWSSKDKVNVDFHCEEEDSLVEERVPDNQMY